MKSKEEIQKNIEEIVTGIQEDILKLEKIYPDGKEEFDRISNNVGYIEMYAYDALGVITKEEQEDMQEQSTEDKNPYQFGAGFDFIADLERIFLDLKPNEIRGFLEEMFENWLPDCSEHGESIQAKYSFIRANIYFLEQMYDKYNFKSMHD